MSNDSPWVSPEVLRKRRSVWHLLLLVLQNSKIPPEMKRPLYYQYALTFPGKPQVRWGVPRPSPPPLLLLRSNQQSPDQTFLEVPASRVHLCYKECCSRTVTPTSSATWLFGSATEQFSQSLPWSLTCPLLAASIVPSSSLSFASDFILSMEKIWLQSSWSSGQTWPCCWFLHPRHSSVSPSASSGMLKRRRSSWFCT